MTKDANNKDKHWKDQEVTELLVISQNNLSIGSNEWEAVAYTYNSIRPLKLPWCPERVADAGNTKFKALKNTRKPTGDPTCPPLVKLAKNIQWDIEHRISARTLDDEEDHDGEEEKAEEEDDDYEADPENSCLLPREDNENIESSALPPSEPITKTPRPKTTTRTGLTEAELIELGKRTSSSSDSSSGSSAVTQRRRHLDQDIKNVYSSSKDNRNFMQIMMAQQMEDRRDEKRQRQEQLESERRREERQEAFQQQQATMQQQQAMLFTALIYQFLPKKKE